jgi:uncharacterized membrane protein YkvA (DUF1232 family)
MDEEEKNEKGDNGGMLKSIIPLAIAIIYAISPLDVIPDIPVIGWIDDGGLVIAAALNLVQHILPEFLGTVGEHLAKIVKFIKWIFIVLCVIAVLIVGVLLTLILKIAL